MIVDSESSSSQPSAETGSSAGTRTLSWLAPALLSTLAAASAWALVYFFFAVPGPWASGYPSRHYSGAQLSLARGGGGVAGTQLVIQSTDAAGIAIASLETAALPATDYRRIRWKLNGVPGGVTLTTLWRSDIGAGRIASSPLELVDEGAEAVLTPGQGGWHGRIQGVALAVNGQLRQPLVIDGVSVDPMDAGDVLADRVHDWLGFRPWTGMSINAAVGGPLEQSVWAPVAAAVVALTAIAFSAFWRRRSKATSGARLSVIALATVGLAWILLDARWLWGRLAQTEATAATFAGKSPRDKHVADIDGYLYAYAEQVRERLPSGPVRVFVAADEHYFGARMAYHLLAHNAYFDHWGGKLPQSSVCKPGDYIVVFGRKDVRFDLEQRMLSWDDQRPVAADMLLAHRGNAMFKLR